MNVRIYYEDTDCGGIVYHTNYLKYCERARSEIFFSNSAMPHADNIGLVVRKIEADFLDSAKLGDLLCVKTQILELKKISILLQQEIFLHNSKCIFRLRVKLACVDMARKRPAVIPPALVHVLERIPPQ